MRKYFILMIPFMILMNIPACHYKSACPIEEHDFIGVTGMFFGIIADILAIPSLILLSIYYKRKFKDPQYNSAIKIFVISSYVLYAVGLWLCLPNCMPLREIEFYFLFGALYVIFILAHIIVHVVYCSRRIKNDQEALR